MELAIQNEVFFRPKKIDSDGSNAIAYPFVTTKVVCVGRNYSEHAKELNNPIPSTPLLFIKACNSLVDLDGMLSIPFDQGECQHELEIALLIGNKLKNADIKQSREAIIGIGLGLDLTLRELQLRLKSKGQPWERAKSFDGACPVSGFVPFPSPSITDLSQVEFLLLKNGKIAQQGNSSDMIFDPSFLISEISRNFTLNPGDIVLTGTPKGVAALNIGDRLDLFLNHQSIAKAIIEA